MIGVYLRVSTNKQDAQAQKLRLKKWVKAQGYERVTWYEDQGKTGRNMNRSGFANLLEDIKKGSIRVVISFELSRITRNQVDALKILALFVEYGVKIELPVKGLARLDPSKSDQLRDMWLKLQFAEEESQRRSERAKAGAERHKVEHGEKSRLGPPKGTKNRLGKFKEYPEHELRQVISLRRQGLSYDKISAEVGKSAGTVRNMLIYLEAKPLKNTSIEPKPLETLPIEIVKNVKYLRSKEIPIRKIAEVLRISKGKVERILND